MNDFQRYALAAGAVALSTVCRWLVDGWLGESMPFVTYFAAVALVGLYLGFGPGIFAAICGGIVSDVLFLPPRYSIALEASPHWIGLILFFLMSGLIILLTEQVRRARERRTRDLEDMNAQKDQFISMVAHELRNPLAAIVSATELTRLRSEELPRETRLAVEVIDRQSALLKHLVDEIVDVARVNGGRLALSRTTVDLAGVAVECIEAVRQHCRKNDVELIASGISESVWVEGDRSRLLQVVRNLLDNACNHTNPGNRILLSLESHGEHCTLRVADTGVGMDPARLDLVFEPYLQTRSSDARQTGGLGVGLYLVKCLVEMHGGSIQVHSDGPGRGAAFTIRLATTAAPVIEPAAVEGLSGRGKILIIDDNRDAAQLLRMLLSRFGQQAEIAVSGEEGLDLARAIRPDVIFIDLLMPGMDGFEVARLLREQFAGNVRLIAVTGLDQQRDKDQARVAGFDDLIVKPATAHEVFGVMSAASA